MALGVMWLPQIAPLLPDSAKDEAGCYRRSLRPVIHRPLHPAWHWNRSDVLALADQVGHNPVLLPGLDVVELQPNHRRMAAGCTLN